MPSDTEIAMAVGQQAFAAVVDKAGQPYWGHCLRVAGRVRADGLDDAAIAAALLHDIVEDGLSSIEALTDLGLSARAIHLIGGLTRDRSLAYLDYVAAIANTGDRDLILIKLADNADNADPARIALLPPGTPHRIERYAAARSLLLAALGRHDG